MTDEEREQLDRLMAEVMGWEEGQPIPAPAYGCAPIDAEIIVPDSDDPMTVAWGTKAVGGTYPFWYAGVVYPGKGEPGFLWQPARLIQQAMMVLEAKFEEWMITKNPRRPQILGEPLYECWVWGLKWPHGKKGLADTEEEAICLAVDATWEKGGDARCL